MADDNLDSGSPTGTAGSPTPQGSAGKSDSGSSIDATKLQTAIDSLTKRLDEVDARSRSLQGEKDKGIKQTKKEVEELKRQFAEIEKLKSSGLDADTAIEEFTFREEVRSLREQLAKLNPASSQPAGNGVSGAESEAQRIARELRLDLNDKEIAEAASKGVTDLFRVAMQKQPNPPSPSDAPPLVGAVPRPVDTAGMIQRLAALQRKPTENRAEIAALTAELDKRGWK